jgi:serine/threonine protein kinase
MPPSKPTYSQCAEDRYKPGYVLDGTYLLKELLGVGGMGSVWRAEHKLMKQDYAVKILAAEKISEENWQRFSLEARAIAKMDHPSIVKIHNMGVDSNEVPYYVMDLLKGITLADLCKPGSRSSVGDLIEIFKQIAQGLSYAHKKGFIHRDVKPSNIVLVNDGKQMRVRIVDFGIAKLTNQGLLKSQVQTKVGEVFGSPLYMSPEQCVGDICDQRSDIYSLGCTLFEVLTKVTPFKGKTSVDTMMMHQNAPVPPLLDFLSPNDPAQEFQPLLNKMLEKSPERRYQSMDALLHDLERLEQGKAIGKETIKMSPLPRAGEGEEEGHHTGKLWVLGAAVIVSLALIAFASAYFLNQATTQEKQKQQAPNPTSLKGFEENDTNPQKTPKESESHDADVEVFKPEDPHKLKALSQAGPIKSKLKSVRGVKMRAIEFPQEMIGYYIYVSVYGRLEMHHAKHYREIPTNVDLTLQVSPEEGMCAFFHPQVFKKVAPDEFSELTLIGKPHEEFVPSLKAHMNKLLPCAIEILEIAASWTTLKSLRLIDVSLDQAKSLDVFNHFKHLKSLSLETISNLPYSQLAKTKLFDKIESLTLKDSGQINPLLQELADKAKFSSLTLGGDQISAETLSILTRYKTLKTLELSDIALDEDKINALARLKNLTSLKYTKQTLTEDQIQKIVTQAPTRTLIVSKRRYRENEKLMASFSTNPHVRFDEELID